MNRTLRSYLPWSVGFLACCFLAFVFFPGLNYYYQDIFLATGINIVLAVSLTLINGFTGQFSLGHAGFMAVGAYTAATLTVFLLPGLHLDPVSTQAFFLGSLVVGGSLAAICGYVVGLPSLRLKGDYLAIVTLGFGEIIRVILLNVPVLGGPRGMTGIPPFANQAWMVFTAFAVVFAVLRLIGTPSGRAMFSVREDEVAAEAMGVNTTRTKVRAFVIGAFWAGVAGGLYAHKFGNINPAAFGFMKSFEVVVIIVLGGLSSVSGAILAAIGLTILPEALRPLQEITGIDFRMVIYSLILILFMLLRPKGLLGRHELSYYWQRFRRRRRPS
jgi:branched-chain amino acid transport system permease protein